MKRSIYIYDTTLRDGSQMEGINFSVNDKLKISKKLSDFGVNFIEGGWPGSNPKDEEYFKKVKKLKLKSEVVAFSSTHLIGKNPSNDKLIQKVLEAKTKWVCVFGKTWDLHTRKILKINNQKALDLIQNTIQFFIKNKRKVIFDAEHFFDGFKSNPKFTMECLRIASKSGADNLTLCDTNGGSLENEIREIIHKVKKEIKTPLGIHTHNDCGLAVANSLTAIREGVELIQGTFNGIGERSGNANLGVIIANLQLKKNQKIIPQKNLKKLTQLSNFIFEIANLPPKKEQPFIGVNAFTHKGGIHASAVRKIPRSYQHIDPKLVGNISRITISELSGKSNVVEVAKRLGFNLQIKSSQTCEILQKVKIMENEGFYFETAEASFALLILRLQKNYKAPFKVLDYFVMNFKNGEAKANVKLKVGNEIREYTASGSGPVNALDIATRRAVEKFFPQIKNIELKDYKVRILDSDAATAAKTRVLVESSNGMENWSTVGCSENIIEASWQALTDSLEYAIWKTKRAG
ncbi:citramalate synthase [Candidatus Gracilibacteria bacterium]|nr:citramalate synthase [Candidatus Gracilibacteria bacterium]